MKIRTKDEIVQRVLKKMDERSLIGQEKYGSTMMGEIKGQVKDLRRFIVDVQEELMDAILYLESANECLQDEIEECYINDRFEPVKCDNVDCGCVSFCEDTQQRMNVIGQNGNTGSHYADDEPYVNRFWTQDNT